MPRHRKDLKRFENKGEARYLTCSCYQRLPLFKNDQIKDLFVAHLILVQTRLPFELYAWVIMPDHFHLLLMPDVSKTTASRILSSIKRPFAAKVLARWRELNASILRKVLDNAGDAHFWQPGGGHDRNIDHPREVEAKVHYTHGNPVARGLVKLATDWKWSSARWYGGDHSYGPKITVPLL